MLNCLVTLFFVHLLKKELFSLNAYSGRYKEQIWLKHKTGRSAILIVKNKGLLFNRKAPYLLCLVFSHQNCQPGKCSQEMRSLS